MTNHEPIELPPTVESMATLNEGLQPFYEAAEGCRQRLLGFGWDPQIAQAIAAQMLSQLIHNALCPGHHHGES